MSTRRLLICAAVCALGLAAHMASAPSYAIDKATPTPAATVIPDDYAVDEALDDLLSLLEDGDFQDALTLADWILGEDAEAWRAYYYRGFAQVQLDDLEAGIENYTQVLELRPWDSQFWRLRGDLHLRDRNPRAARRDYKRALFHTPRSSEAFQRLAELHERDIDKRLNQLYEVIIEAQIADARGSSNRAINLLTDLIEGFDRGSNPPELGYAYYTRARIWTGQDLREQALADLSTAIELQPEMPDYYLSRGALYAQAKQPALAGEDFYQRMILLERESLDAEIDDTQAVTAEMAHGRVARLRFRGTAGQRVTIAARDYLGAGVDPLLILLSAEGFPLAGDDSSGGELDAMISNVALPTDGTYTLMLSHANGGFEGMVRLSLRRVSEDANS